MPYCPTGQEFWPEYNVDISAPKLADRIFSGPRKNWKILYIYIYIYTHIFICMYSKKNKKKKKKKNLGKICTKMPFCPTGQKFWPECNVDSR